MAPHMEDGRGSETWVGGRSDEGGGVEWESSVSRNAGDGGAKDLEHRHWGEEEFQGGGDDWGWEGESAAMETAVCLETGPVGGEVTMEAGWRGSQASAETLGMAVHRT